MNKKDFELQTERLFFGEASLKCQNCGETVNQYKQYIEIVRYHDIGAVKGSLIFHMDCFEAVAGKKFIP